MQRGLRLADCPSSAWAARDDRPAVSPARASADTLPPSSQPANHCQCLATASAVSAAPEADLSLGRRIASAADALHERSVGTLSLIFCLCVIHRCSASTFASGESSSSGSGFAARE